MHTIASLLGKRVGGLGTGSFKGTCGGRNIESDIVGSRAIILLILAWRKYAKLEFILSLTACLFQVT